MGQEYLIAFGGNLPSLAGTPDDTLRAAVERIERAGGRVADLSRFYRTPCFPAGFGPDYVNAAACVEFDGPAEALLALLNRVENEFGRERSQRWGSRTLDLDLIAAGDSILPDEAGFLAWMDLPPDRQIESKPDRLILPHPRLQDRAFVLVPLADVAPDWVHPVLKKSVKQLLHALPDEDVAQVVAL